MTRSSSGPGPSGAEEVLGSGGARSALWPRQASREGGSATVEAALIVPAMMLVLLLVVQVGLWALADEAAQQVAARTAVAAADFGGSTRSAELAGTGDASAVAGPLLVHPTIAVTESGAGTVVAAVAGRAASILPWFDPAVRSVRQATVQRFRPGS